MTDLSKEIEELVSLKNEYETKRERLNDKVMRLFNPEFERIKSKMPEGYEIGSFDVYNGTVCIPNPCFKGNVVENIANGRQLDYLNGMFREEFSRIREKYGFRVKFYHTEYIG